MKNAPDKSRLSPNEITLGIIGGGQLGKMMGLEARRMSINLAYLDPEINCPASTISDQMIVSDFKDEEAIIELAKKSDVLTYEIELANSSVLKGLESRGYVVHPASQVLYTIQNKIRQKKFLRDNRIPVPDFEEVISIEQAKKIGKEFLKAIITFLELKQSSKFQERRRTQILQLIIQVYTHCTGLRE